MQDDRLRIVPEYRRDAMAGRFRAVSRLHAAMRLSHASVKA